MEGGLKGGREVGRKVCVCVCARARARARQVHVRVCTHV